ncbi:MAG: hypothetical protein KGI98_03495 [Euryarchaeota archaeon]|nr:hypothetical protein [Euryarchaeota archaeon]MDE1880216.1 hypothetical protein [Euryarchaeota archaeon]
MGAPPQAAGTPPPGYPQQGYPAQQPPAYGQPPPGYGAQPPAYGQAPAWGGAPQPYAMPQAPMRPPRPHGYKHQKRLIASILLLVGAVLLIVSIATPFWSDTESGSGVTYTIQFFAGNEWKEICSGSSCPTGTLTCTYSSSGGGCPALTNTGNLYGGVSGLLTGAIVLGFIAAILGLMGALALSFGRIQMLLTWLLILVALALAIAAPMWALGGQPGALTSDYSSGSCAGTSPCNSFFGNACPSGTPSGVSCNWGAGAGWYMAIAGFALLLVGFLFLFMTRRDPFTVQEILQAQQAGMLSPTGAVGHPMAAAAPAAASWGGPAAAYGAAPAAAAAAPAAGGAPGPAPNCTKCGQPTEYVAQYSRWYCRRDNQYV